MQYLIYKNEEHLYNKNTRLYIDTFVLLVIIKLEPAMFYCKLVKWCFEK